MNININDISSEIMYSPIVNDAALTLLPATNDMTNIMVLVEMLRF
jgi:hypothetical protein